MQGSKLQTAFIIVRGRMKLNGLHSSSSSPPQASRPSVKSAALSMPGSALRKSKALLSRSKSEFGGPKDDTVELSTLGYEGKQFVPGDTVGLLDCDNSTCESGSVTVSAGPCWILEVDKANESGIAWLVKARAVFCSQQEREREMLSYP